MIGIDTNVLLRLFDQDDDPSQSARAQSALRANAPVFINNVVLVEYVWTCASFFKLGRAEIHKRLAAIIEAPEFTFAWREAVERAVRSYGQRKFDFADRLIGESNTGYGCQTTLTFDESAVKGGSFTQVAS